jgi:hypothetical protein
VTRLCQESDDNNWMFVSNLVYFQQRWHHCCSWSIVWDPDSIVDELQNGFHERVSPSASVQHYLALVPNGESHKLFISKTLIINHIYSWVSCFCEQPLASAAPWPLEHFSAGHRTSQCALCLDWTVNQWSIGTWPTEGKLLLNWATNSSLTSPWALTLPGFNRTLSVWLA